MNRRMLVLLSMCVLLLPLSGCKQAAKPDNTDPALWTQDYPGTDKVMGVFDNTADGAVAVVTRAGMDVTFERFDLQGNLIHTQTFPDILTNNNAFSLIPVGSSAFFLATRADSETALLWYGDTRAATMNSLSVAPELQAIEGLRFHFQAVNHQGNLMFTASTPYTAEGPNTNLVGWVTPTGQFQYHAVNPLRLYGKLHRLGNTQSYAMTGYNPYAYSQVNGMEGYVLYLNAQLEVTAEHEYPREFTVLGAFNNGLSGYFRHTSIEIVEYHRIDVTGVAHDVENDAFIGDVVYGPEGYYTVLSGTGAPFAGPRICRFDYQQTRHFCLSLPPGNGSGLLAARVLDNGNLTLSLSDYSEYVNNVRLDIAEAQWALLLGGTVSGSRRMASLHHIVSADGRWLRQGAETPYAESGHVSRCEVFLWTVPCLVAEPELTEPGICETEAAVGLETNQVFALNSHCEYSERKVRREISLW